jgi:hypothetical protein
MLLQILLKGTTCTAITFLFSIISLSMQDVLGDTPLHDAISERHDESATILIQHPNIDVWLQNIKKFNVMHLACLKGHAWYISLLHSYQLFVQMYVSPEVCLSAKVNRENVGLLILWIADTSKL